jgi:hypothetical protein
MPINMTLALRDVHLRVGVRRKASPHRFTDAEWQLDKLRGQRLGVWFHWSDAHNFVRLRAWRSGPAGAEKEFETGKDAVRAVYKTLGVSEGLEDEFLAKKQFVAGVVPRDGQVRLLFCVDTDSESFKKAFEKQGSGPQLLNVPISTRVFDSEVDEEEDGVITLVLEPGVQPPELDGFLAVDVGNTSCTLAVHEGMMLGSAHLCVVEGEAATGCTDAPEAPFQRDRPDSAGSAIRIDVINRQLADKGMRDHPSCFVWAIGKRALEQQSGDGVVLGAKRLLASADFNEPQDVQVWPRPDFSVRDPRVPIPLPRRLPAELLLCRLFQRFRESKLRQLPPLALTYPTSYSRREIEQVREGARRAIVRQKARAQSPEELTRADKLIERMIDEASAAAFYFLFRDIVETPPGLLRFSYLYPHGQNLLLYDCGGGTTDVALVHASTKPDDPGLLHIEVRGRSGVRNFGGDEITVAVFRLLKANIAAKIQEVQGKSVTIRLPPDSPETVVKVLNERAADVNKALPTQYTPRDMTNEDRTRRNHTRHLWQRATLAKHQLDRPGEDVFASPFPPDEPFADVFSQALLGGLSADTQERLRNGLRGIKIRRKDVDAMVRDRVVRSVRCCNHLIRRCLAPMDRPPEEIHRVVILGNGSRYPLIQELLRGQLDVPFYDDRLTKVAPNDLKTAVAKGAALALGSEKAALDIRIDFDWSMTNRLPFDVGVLRFGKGAVPRWLFFEGERIEDIAQRQEMVDVVTPGEGQGKATKVQLVRRWPGDDEPEGYLQFEFPYGVEGQVVVEFDEAREFRVMDHLTGNPGQLIGYGDTGAYVHPVERGTL